MRRAVPEAFQLPVASLVAALGASLLALLAGLALGRRWRRPHADALLDAVGRWTAGDLTARAALREPPDSPSGRLGRAFNDLAARCAAQQAELDERRLTAATQLARGVATLAAERDRLAAELADRDAAAATLREAQKLQVVGQLAGGIAHDFNNLLTAIVGALDLLRGRLPPGQEPLLRLVDSALQAAERGSRLTGQLLAFSRRQRLLPVPTDLNLTVLALSDLVGSTLGRAVRVQTDLVQDLWPAMIDPSQLEAAIVNLVANARDAMPEGGVLTIATRNRSVAVGGRAPPGDYVVLRVSDTGAGMSAEVLARAFEPFFTGAPPGTRSGLGLSQVHGLVAQSGGEVRLESSLGAGTTVTLLLPRATGLPTIRTAAPPGALRGRPRVLVVDDDRDVRDMIGEMLSGRGYEVTVVADPFVALTLLQQEPGFDLLLADYVMPGMNGGTLIRQIQAFRPGQRVLLMTGNASFADEDAIAAEHVIRKPFTIARLGEQLERALARPVLRAVPGGLMSPPG